MEWILGLLSVETIVRFLAKKAKEAGTLFLLRFRELCKDNTDLLDRLRAKQAEMAGQKISGSKKAEMVVDAVLEDIQEVGNDALRALLFALNGVIFFEDHYATPEETTEN